MALPESSQRRPDLLPDFADQMLGQELGCVSQILKTMPEILPGFLILLGLSILTSCGKQRLSSYLHLLGEKWPVKSPGIALYCNLALLQAKERPTEMYWERRASPASKSHQIGLQMFFTNLS